LNYVGGKLEEYHNSFQMFKQIKKEETALAISSFLFVTALTALRDLLEFLILPLMLHFVDLYQRKRIQP